MKHGKAAGILLAIANMAMITLCVVLYIGQDRTKPVFGFQEANTVYKEDMTTDTPELFEGITAWDDRDGDITGRIVIEKIIENQEAGSAVVFYAVSDKAGNVAKASRVFGAVYVKEASAKSAVSSAEGLLEAGIHAEFGDGPGRGAEEEGQGEGDAPKPDEGRETPSPTGAEPEASESPRVQAAQAPSASSRSQDGQGGTVSAPTSTPQPTNTPASTPEREAQGGQGEGASTPGPGDTQPENSAAPEGETAPESTGEQEMASARQVQPDTAPAAPEGAQGQAQPENAQEPEQGAAGIPPVLTLKSSEVRVNAGNGPAWTDVIDNLSDDRDDYGTLFGNLKVSEYNRNEPGTYQVNVYTIDSDGNRSAEVPLTIVVQ